MLPNVLDFKFLIGSKITEKLNEFHQILAKYLTAFRSTAAVASITSEPLPVKIIPSLSSIATAHASFLLVSSLNLAERSLAGITTFLSSALVQVLP